MLDTAPEAPVVESTPAPAAPAPEAPAAIVEKEAPADKAAREEKALDDDLRKVFRNANKPRDEDGKFASKDGKPKEEAPAKPLEAAKLPADPKAEKPAEVKPEPVKPAVPPPQAWKAEVREKWATLPPDVQSYIAEREQAAHQRISELGQKAQVVEQLESVWKPHEYRLQGISKPDYLNSLLAADSALRQDPVGFIKLIAQHNNIDLNSMVSDPYAVADPQSAQVQATLQAANARIEQLERQLGEVGQRVIGRETAERQAKEQEYNRMVEEFGKGKEDWQDLLPDMMANAAALVQANPNRPPQEVLQEAYERSQWGNPKTRKAMMERQAKEAEAKRLEEAKAAADRAKRAGSINVRNAPPVNGKASLDDDLRAVWRRLNS